ncbi:MAG: hypothetical protein WKI04_19615 [Ferruginibacter sp.]
MNLDVLMNLYANDPRCFQIADGITLPQPQHVHLSGLLGSASQFVVAAVFNHPAAAQTNHLIILRDAEEAAYFHNTLENITKALDIFYFPSSFKNNKNYQLLNSSHVMLRTEALTRIASSIVAGRDSAKKIIVTHPEALYEKVVLPKTLSANIISIKQADVLDVNGMLERFVNYGFVRTDFVYEPGQFAVRGGILDVYSFGNEKPYRIELFGNEVDSIRIFDPENQLSERKLLQVNIIPNVETQFESGEKVSLLEFLPGNTAVWMEDWNFIRERIEQQEEDFELWLLALGDNPSNDPHVQDDLTTRKNIDGNDFVKANEIEKQLQAKHIIEIGKKIAFTRDIPKQNQVEIKFNTKEQPAFNRQFNLLIKNLRI